MDSRLLVTCEHGGNRVPHRYTPLFAGARNVLGTHQGFDPGTLELARRLARAGNARLFASTVTRLLVELNRSPGHPRLFSPYTRALDHAARQRLMDAYYWPHRRAIEAWIAEVHEQGLFVLHVGVHSFAPNLDGRPRRTDVGWLYDPASEAERRWTDAWRDQLKQIRPELNLRRNHPYLGKSDGLTTHLRRVTAPGLYAGIELEVNQRWPLGERKTWIRLQHDLIASLARAGDYGVGHFRRPFRALDSETHGSSSGEHDST
jgi:predicted N-formylglutamate amidohydrolase